MKVIFFVVGLASLLVFLSIKILNKPCEGFDKCVVFSQNNRPAECAPKESNDCSLDFATVVEGDSLALSWQSLVLKAKALPKESWYKVLATDEKNYHLILYPHMGEPLFLGAHDYEVWIFIQSLQENPKPMACDKIEFNPDLRDFEAQNGDFKIKVQHRLNYHYKGAAGSNPNPFDGRRLALLESVTTNLQWGACH